MEQGSPREGAFCLTSPPRTDAIGIAFLNPPLHETSTMRLATVLIPESDENLRLAKQAGVEEVVIRCPGTELDELLAIQQRIESFGLRVGAIEGYLPIEQTILGDARRDAEIAQMKRLIENMGTAGVPILCYNFMAGTDWVRTSIDHKQRGDALVTAFDVEQAERSVSLEGSDHEGIAFEAISAETLWKNLEYFLDGVLATAETNGVFLAMHPDDPPLDEFLGRARIMNSVEAFERLLALRESPANTVCFCQGTFAEMGVDIPSAIRRLGKGISYVHFRDVEGTAERFSETFHDNGPTDMFAAMCAYREIGFDGSIRPDHVPQLVGEEEGEPGYTMLGRLHAYGYMTGLMQASEAVTRRNNTQG